MEFTNEISFNNKLIENKIAKINYHGRLFKEGSQELTIVYGFGNNWEYTQEKQMIKQDDGFEVEIEIKPYNTFNFCFRNENYNWDNNNSFNYISPIDKEIFEPAEKTNKIEKLSATEQELNKLENEISLLFDELFDAPDETPNITPSFTQNDESEKLENFDLDALIEEILNPVVASTDSVAVLENLAQEVDEPSIKQASNVENIEDEVSEFPTHTQKTSTLVEDILVPYYEDVNNISKVEDGNLSNVDNLIESLADENVEIPDETPVTPAFQKIENIEELFEQDAENIEATTEVSVATIEETKKEENIQKTTETPVQEKSTVFAEAKANTKKDFTIIEDDVETSEPSLLEEVKQEKANEKVEENVALSVVENQNTLLVSPRRLSKFYFIKKKVKLAFYKALVSIPKFLHKQFDSSENN